MLPWFWIVPVFAGFSVSGILFWCCVNSENFWVRAKFDSISPFGNHNYFCDDAVPAFFRQLIICFFCCDSFSKIGFCVFPMLHWMLLLHDFCRGLSARAPFQGRQKQVLQRRHHHRCPTMPPPGTCTFMRQPAVLIITSIWGLLLLLLSIKLVLPISSVRRIVRFESNFQHYNSSHGWYWKQE